MTSNQMGGQDAGKMLHFGYKDSGPAVFVSAGDNLYKGREDPRIIMLPPKGMSVNEAVEHSRSSNELQYETVLHELLERIESQGIA